MFKRFFSFILFVSILTSLFAAKQPLTVHAAGRCYVKWNAGGTNNGINWTNAYTSLQPAIADSCTEIWVAAGTYTPDASVRTMVFGLENGTSIYGGFNGTETLLTDRDSALNVTILSGDLNGDDSGFTNNGENSYHVIWGSGKNSTAILDGFTIQGGNANGAGFPQYFGGGMYSDTGNPNLTNITFSNNSATYGGGIYNFNSSPTLTNVNFSTNSATSDSGGMYNNSTSNPSLTNVTFSNNSATINGGGMLNSNVSSPTLTNVAFSNNSAAKGGGMYNDNSSPTLTNVTFSGNPAVTTGGGMYNISSSNPTLTNVTFSGNSANDGGGMSNFNSSPNLTNVTFSGNTVVNNGGGMYNNTNSSPSLTNLTFSGNSSSGGYGGGMSNYNNSNPTLMNVTFSGNNADNNRRGGMFNESSSPTLKNTIIADSTGGDCANNLSILNAASSNNLIEDAANACGLTNGVNGNIIGFDPKLGPLADNGGFTKTHALLAGSLAINAGTNTGCPATDQSGMNRSDGSCDIGAYEYRGPYVVSVTRQDVNPTNASSVVFLISFSDLVSGVFGFDMSLTTTGAISGASIANVSNVDDVNYEVTVNTGTGNGTIRLDVPINQNIVDNYNHPLISDYMSGEVYNVDKTIIQTFQSIGSQDGWILESSEASNKGGAMNNSATLLYVGDDVQNKQYRSYLSFNTDGLPDNNIVITNVKLKIKIQGFVGGNMFIPTKTLGNLIMDIREPYFGTNANLVVSDFQSAVSQNAVGIIGSMPSTGWRTITLKTTAYQYVNLTGKTQFRLRFQKDDNDDLSADYIKVFSGDASVASRPQLIVEYYMP